MGYWYLALVGAGLLVGGLGVVAFSAVAGVVFWLGSRHSSSSLADRAEIQRLRHAIDQMQQERDRERKDFLMWRAKRDAKRKRTE